MQVFSCVFGEISKSTFSIEYLQTTASIDGEILYLKGPSLGSDLFSDKAYHKNKYLCKVSFSNDN